MSFAAHSITGEGKDVELIHDRRQAKRIADLTGLNVRRQHQAIWDFIYFVRDNVWTAADRAAGVEIEDVVAARPNLHREYQDFKAWLEDSYEGSDAKANGITLEQLERAPHSAWAEYLESTTPPPPKPQTRRVETCDDSHTKGSEMLHCERFGYLAGHPYKAIRIRSKNGVSKSTTMLFPDYEQGGWKVGATKYSDGRKVVKTGVVSNPQTGQRVAKPLRRVVLRHMLEAC